MSPLAMFLAAIEEINMAVGVKFDRNSDLKSPGGAAAGACDRRVGAEAGRS